MPYITAEQFAERFGQAEFDDLTADASFDIVEAEAAALVNGYLSARYTLPLSSVPAMVAAWAADITRYRLWDNRAPEEVRRRYEDALQQLQQVARGVIALPPGADGSKPAAGGLAFGGYSADRIFTSDTLAGF